MLNIALPSPFINIPISKRISPSPMPFIPSKLPDIRTRVWIHERTRPGAFVLTVFPGVAGAGGFPDIGAGAVAFAVLVLAVVGVAVWKEVAAISVATTDFVSISCVGLGLG
jgi:hypothetical protein